jgi:hypothetical protein
MTEQVDLNQELLFTRNLLVCLINQYCVETGNDCIALNKKLSAELLSKPINLIATDSDLTYNLKVEVVTVVINV